MIDFVVAGRQIGVKSERVMKLIVPALMTLSLVLIAGCSTIQGVGNDLSSAGRAISKTAGNMRR